MEEKKFVGIGSRFDQVMDKTNITQQQIIDLYGELTGDPRGSTGTITKVTKGENLPNGKTLLAVLTLRPDVNLNWIFTGNGEMFLNQPEAEKLADADITISRQARQIEKLKMELEKAQVFYGVKEPAPLKMVAEDKKTYTGTDDVAGE